MVSEAITSRHSVAPSPNVSLLDEIALKLDVQSVTLANWSSLAVKLGVPRKTFKLFERRSTQSPTNHLFEYLGSTCPRMTVKTLEEALTKMERKDLLAILHEKSPQGKLNSYLRLDNKLQRFSTMLRCDAILQRKRMLITETVHANRY